METLNGFSEFSHRGYHIERELGHNRAGGRVTYLATAQKTQQLVVIKQFQFARAGSNWSDYEAYQREIQILRDLNHPGIPRYLDSFQGENGFCMVQEYKNALSLAVTRSFNPDEIRHIAVAVLEILVYLQNRIPPVIHRDIKPDNILIDDQNRIYLVDFGFARIGDGEVGVSSVVKGTLGFMPPEQLFNRQLTEASDLYGLGMTLICLLTGTKADDIGNLVDISYRIKFKHLVPKLNHHWVKWLEKMVESRIKDRYPNAIAALDAAPASSICLPEVRLNRSSLEFKAIQLRENLVQAIAIHNPVPGTSLQGTWEIDPHPSDPPLDADGEHAWIRFKPKQFEGNHTECFVTVDTSKLRAEQTYHRMLRLRTNTLPESYSLPLQVQTAPIPIRSEQIAYRPLLLLFLFTLAVMRLVVGLMTSMNPTADGLAATIFGHTVGAAVGLELAAWTLGTVRATTGAIASCVGGGIVGLLTILMAWFMTGALAGSIEGAIVGSVFGITAGWLLGIATGITVEKLLESDVSKGFAIKTALLVTACAVSLLPSLTVGLQNAISIIAFLGTGLPLSALLISLPLRRTKLISSYRRLERHLIRS